MTPLVFVLCFFTPVMANILMPPSFFNAKTDLVIPTMSEQEMDAYRPSDDDNGSKNYAEQHNRNCFFTPVQCMLPLTDSHKDVQSLHGVYSPNQVRRSVDTMLTSPWGYTDLIKRGGDNRFYQWLSRY